MLVENEKPLAPAARVRAKVVSRASFARPTLAVASIPVASPPSRTKLRVRCRPLQPHRHHLQSHLPSRCLTPRSSWGALRWGISTMMSTWMLGYSLSQRHRRSHCRPSQQPRTWPSQSIVSNGSPRRAMVTAPFIRASGCTAMPRMPFSATNTTHNVQFSASFCRIFAV